MDTALIIAIEAGVFNFLNKYFEKEIPPEDETMEYDEDVVEEY